MKRRRAAGFTLVELMTVVTIIGVIASIAVLSLRRSRSQNDADAWANTLRNVVNQARRRATATGTPYQVELTTTSVRWCQIPAASCSADAAPTCALAADCTGTGTTCEKGAITYAGTDALTDSWYASADVLFKYTGTTNSYAPPTHPALVGTKPLYFGPVGSVDDTCSDVMLSPPDPTKSAGFTIYVRAANNVPSATSETQKHRRIVIYGVTGRPRIVDQW